MYLKAIIEDVSSARLAGDNIEGWESVWVEGLSDDSRYVREGDLFFCRMGEHYDTHTFAEDAKRRGAVALVCEREVAVDLPQILVDDCREGMALMAAAFYGNPSKRLRIIGITGTNGKTTTSYLLASILRATGKSVGVIGTLGIYYGRKSIAPELTTPDPIFLQKTLADMVQEGVEYAVMEVSAHALYFKKEASIRYAACIFTNFSQDHLDFFGTMERYAEAKQLLFASKKCDVCILNGDDALAREIGEKRGKGVFYYGLDTPSDAFAIVEEKTGKNALEAFTEALNNVMPVLEVKARRVGGSTYQVPMEVRAERKQTLGLRWIRTYSRNRSERTMAEKLAGEIMDAINNVGGAVKKKEETHRMAEANKAFAHYRY